MTDPTEEALWQAIGAMPADALRRGVLADYLDERHAESGVWVRCEMCDATGRWRWECKV